MKKIHRVILFFSLYCICLNIYNIIFIRDIYPVYLSWNLLLAFTPYLLAIYFVQSVKKRGKKNKWIQGLLLFGWLIFFPNAMYMVTDFLHLYEQTYLPAWFDIAQIFCFTFVAFLLGFLSLYKIEKILTKKIGSNRSLLFVISSVFLSSVGVYLGRNLRWNSWDLFIYPWQIIMNFVNILSHLHSFLNFIGMTVVFSCMFLGVYFSLSALLHTKEKEL